VKNIDINIPESPVSVDPELECLRKAQVFRYDSYGKKFGEEGSLNCGCAIYLHLQISRLEK
jgi:hypothetical protein